MVITEEQLKERRGYIGASEIADIVGLSPFANSAMVWLMKVKGSTKKTTSAMSKGTEAEPLIISWSADQIAKRLGKEIEECVDNPEFRRTEEGKAPIVSHLDALLRFKDGTQAVLEAKDTFLVEDYGTPWSGEVPMHVAIQVTAQMALSGVHTGYVGVFTRENKRAVYEVEYDPELWAICLEKCDQFWNNHVLTGVRPDGEVSLELLERMDRYDEDNILELSEFDSQKMIDDVDSYELAKKERREAQRKVDKCRMQVLENMKDHSTVLAKVKNQQMVLTLPNKGRKVLKIQRG